MPGGVPQVPTNVNVPAPDYAALVNQTQGPLAQVVQGFTNYINARNARKLFDAQLQQTQAQTQRDQAQSQVEMSQATTMQQTQALALYQQFGAIGVNNEAITKSPQWQQRMSQLAQAAGMPDPIGPDGTFDRNQFLKPMGPKDVMLANEMHPGPQKTAFLKQFSNVTPDMFTQGPDYTGKELAAIGRMQQMGIHLQNADETARLRAMIDQRREQLAAELNPYKKAQLQAEVNRDNAEAARATADAGRAAQQARELSQEIAAGLPQLKVLAQQYKLNPAMGGALAQQYRHLVTSAERAKEQLAGAEAALNDAANRGADPSTLQQLGAKAAAAKATYQQASSMLRDTYSQLQSLSGDSNALRVGMGAKSVGIGGGKLNLPAPPSAITDTPTVNPVGSDSSRVAPTEGGPYIDTARLPKGAQQAIGPDGKIYYKVGDNYYNSDGEQIFPGNQ